MARQAKSLESARITFLVMALLLLCLVWTADSRGLGAEIHELPAKVAESWCIAKPSESDAMLQEDITFACGPGGVDCSIIQPKGTCYEPGNLVSYASVVMNLYYKRNGMKDNACVFSNTGLIVWQDPSVGPCIYQ